MAIKFKCCPNITFINKVTKPAITSVQFADDVTLLITDEGDLRTTLSNYRGFVNLSGPRLNKQKSKIIPINRTIRNHEGITWIQDEKPMRILGTFFKAEAEIS